MENLAKRYRPIVYLHPDESYYPCSIEWYLSHSDVWYDGRILDGRFTAENIITGPESQMMSLEVVPESKHGALDKAPVYTHISTTSDGDYRITYIFLYAYNGSLSLCGFPCKCCQVGSHNGDVEHVTLILDKNTDKVKKLYYAAHGRKEGRWLEPSQVSWESTHPVVYSAKHTHASYPSTGTICRCVGAINDHTKKGRLWFPDVELITDNTKWNMFQGYLGYPDHVKTPYHQYWWLDDSKISGSKCDKIFCLGC